MTTQYVTRRLNLDVRGIAAMATKDLLISTAKQVLAEEVARGFDPDPRRVVDGRFDGMLSAVKPFGHITLSERVPLGPAALWIHEQMRKRALDIRITGDLAASVTIFVEKTPVDPVLGALNRALANDPEAAVWIAPVIIYAKRIEKKHRIVDTVYRLANTRFGKSMFVTKATLYAGEIGRIERVTRRKTNGRDLATPMEVEATFPAIRIYRYGSVGSFAGAVN